MNKPNEMSREDFQAKQKWHGWEVFSEAQVANYGMHVATLLAKSQENELNEQESSALKIGQSELNNLKPIVVVEQQDGRIVKNLLYIQEPQIQFEDSFQKSESGETIQKGIFLDTPLNRELGRVGQELIKGCAKKDITKTEEYKFMKAMKEKGVTSVYDELKKAFPEVTDEKYGELEKAFSEPEEEEEMGDEEGEEIEKSIERVFGVIENNLEKGLIDKLSAESAKVEAIDFFMKGRTKEGVYANTAKNRKLGLVGKPYKKGEKKDSKKGVGKENDSEVSLKDLKKFDFDYLVDEYEDKEEEIEKFIIDSENVLSKYLKKEVADYVDTGTDMGFIKNVYKELKNDPSKLSKLKSELDKIWEKHKISLSR